MSGSNIPAYFLPVIMWVKKRLPTRKMVQAIAIPVVIGLPLSLMLAWHLLQLENNKEIAGYEQQADQVMSVVNQELRSNDDVLMSASFLLNADPGASPETLVQFMTPYLVLRPEIDSVTWICEVPEALRTAFEKKARRFSPGFAIHDVNGKAAPALSSGHFPVYFQHPVNDLAGLDLATVPPVLAAIFKARKENAVITLPSTLRGSVESLHPDPETRPLIVDLLYPVYLNGSKFSGVMGLTVNLDNMIATIIADFPVAGMQMRIKKGADALHAAMSDNPGSDSWIKSLGIGNVFSSERSFKIGDNGHLVDFTFTNATPWVFRHKIVFFVLFACIGIISLLSIYWVSIVKLGDARDRAEAASKSKSLFLANMSHEIRTPMNGVMGMVEQVLDTDLARQQREWLEIAHSSAETLLSIINDILDLSKIEAGEFKIEIIPYELHSVIETVTDLLYVRASAKGLVMIVDIGLDLPNHITGDPLRLRQIIMNLVSNALKFTERGQVSISARYVSEAPPMLRFEVEDTGIGIPAGKLSGVFKGFSQAEESTTRRFGGTGLGLSISKNLVEMMGGEIGVKSITGKGSRFWFTLPVKLDMARTTRKLKMPDDLAAARVLVIEYSVPEQQHISGYLNSWGIKCDTVADVKAAFVAFSNSSVTDTPYQFVIIDAELAGWLSLLEYLALMPEVKNHTLRVLLYGPNSMLFDEQSLKSKGVSAVLTKPLYPSRLFDMLNYLWQRKADDLTELVTRRTLTQVKVNPARLAATAAASGARPASVRALLVDDQPVNRQLMQIILDKMKCKTDMACNGIEAVQKAKNNEYDIIFMDCHMPEMDGYEATRQIRAFEKAHSTHIPIIALTADAMQGAREVCMAAGMDDYINKPVRSASVQAIIDKYAQ